MQSTGTSLHPPPVPRSTGEHLLITGLAHPLARRIASLASTDGSERVVHLVADPTELELAQAIAAGAEPPGRVEVLEGDPCAMDLGLSGAEYTALCRHLDRIHHLAHSVDTSLDAETLLRRNVSSALEAVELARSAGGARLVFHSSVFAAESEGGVAYERPCRSRGDNHDPLGFARRSAEAIALRASGEIPVVLLRTSGVVPVLSRDRPILPLATNPNLLGLLLVLAHEAREASAASAPFAALARALSASALHLAPIDFVARACLALGRHPDAAGATLHLVAPSPPTIGQIADRIRAILGPNRRLAVGRALVAPKLLGSLARAPRAFVERIAVEHRFDSRNAAALLASEGLAWPPWQSYVEPLCEVLEAELSPRS